MASYACRFSLALAVLLLTWCTVAGFRSSPNTVDFRRSLVLCAKKNDEPIRATRTLSRATRTLYKPQQKQEKFVLDELDLDLLELEKEIEESTKAKLDLKRISEMLEEEDQNEQGYAEAWQVSIAAGGTAGLVTLGTTDSWTLAILALVGAYVLANGDPLQEQTPAGAAARVVGRAALSFAQAIQPKAKSLARVVFKGDDQITILNQRIEELEAENADLRLYRQRREAVDNSLNKYTVSQLKSIAREHKLAVGGTKSQLLLRLVEADAIDLSP